jgi:hypothetical protein
VDEPVTADEGIHTGKKKISVRRLMIEQPYLAKRLLSPSQGPLHTAAGAGKR